MNTTTDGHPNQGSEPTLANAVERLIEKLANRIAAVLPTRKREAYDYARRACRSRGVRWVEAVHADPQRRRLAVNRGAISSARRPRLDTVRFPMETRHATHRGLANLEQVRDLRVRLAVVVKANDRPSDLR